MELVICSNYIASYQYLSLLTLYLPQYFLPILAYILNEYNKPHRFKMSTSIFHKLSTKKAVPQHCPQDISCGHCCQHCLLHRKEYETKYAILLAKYEEVKKEGDFLRGLNMELKGKLDQLERKARKFRDLEAMGEELRREIEEELGRKREVQDAIIAEKISILEQNNKQLLEDLAKITDLNNNNESKIKQLQLSLLSAQNKNQNYQQELEQLKQDNTRLEAKQLELYELVQSYEKRIDEKTRVIEQLRKTINDIEGKYIIQRAKASNFGTQKDLLQLNLKNKNSYIETLTKCSQQNLKNLHNIQSNNAELKNLVSVLDSEAMAGRINEQYFRERLIESEGRLVATEGLAYYNGQKVELMKNDLYRLKLTI